MTKTLLTAAMAALAAAIPAAGVGAGAFTASEAFVDAPTLIFPTIDRSTRLDMLDYYNSGSTKASRNRFEGDCRVTALSPMQLTFTTSEVAEHTISLVTRHKNDTIIMLITTLKTPAEDSHVKFYSRSWQPIQKGLFMVPGLNDWVRPESRDNMSDIENAVPYMLAKAAYEPGSGTLTITNNLQDYLPDEVVSMVQPAMVRKISYRWNGHKMVRLKE